MNILLIEDSQTCAEIFFAYARTLQNGKRWTIDHVTHLSHLRHWTGFDVIVTDLSLPDSSAKETVAWIGEATKFVPVIVLSGNPDKTIIDACLEAGAVGFLSKDSLSTTQIATTLRTAVQLSSRSELQKRLNRLEAVCEEKGLT